MPGRTVGSQAQRTGGNDAKVLRMDIDCYCLRRSATVAGAAAVAGSGSTTKVRLFLGDGFEPSSDRTYRRSQSDTVEYSLVAGNGGCCACPRPGEVHDDGPVVVDKFKQHIVLKIVQTCRVAAPGDIRFVGTPWAGWRLCLRTERRCNGGWLHERASSILFSMRTGCPKPRQLLAPNWGPSG
jgi:hypothetical protein